ncbi:MAG TPA: DUF2062 domain-containing protein [bacterium]|nr:DUF2062 domain-containing protein [bacterium]HPS29751.1 DUF2062 domain-containing protein [bacterium]
MKGADIQKKLKEWAVKLVTQNSSPHELAFGLAAGVFVGALPIMGIQMIVVLFLLIPFKNVNRFAAASGVWYTNPVTFIPIYAFTYWVGTLFYHSDDVLNYAAFATAFQGRDTLTGFFNLLKEKQGFFLDLFICTWIGGFIVGVILAIPTYYITKRAVEKYRNFKNPSSNKAE